jgi:hypothetical protein
MARGVETALHRGRSESHSRTSEGEALGNYLPWLARRRCVAPIADSSSARLWKPYHKVRGARRRHSGGPRVAIDVEGLGPKSRSPPALALDFLPDSQPLFAFGREGLLALGIVRISAPSLAQSSYSGQSPVLKRPIPYAVQRLQGPSAYAKHPYQSRHPLDEQARRGSSRRNPILPSTRIYDVIFGKSIPHFKAHPLRSALSF